ncbi:MAG: hypothetical protein FD161_3013 [Limisphaerales bacterium]|nr:MAG: hypothetical protein FD161_3013 [Limisphaerales bacterium]KAG0508126.1 MAG: hypothetical protein E1N63_2720 [Limisphaerales bacterium]TXT53021.1 MAG: hypothetical protein FD140_129 [Limisphaerales bacterium]
MTELKLKQLVTEAVALDRDIREQEARLKELKTALITEAESRPDELKPTDNGGRSLVFTGTDGCVCCVAFPAPTLKSKIDGEGKPIEKIKAAAGRVFDRLFRAAVTYKPVDNFREEAAALLGKDAGKLVKLCQTESAARVSFETKDSEA